MKVLALETNREKLNASFLTPGEKLLGAYCFHGVLFFVRFLQCLVLTALLVGAVIAVTLLGAPLGITLGVFFVLWFFVVFLPLLTSFIDWKYDVLLLTDQKLVVVNQSSIFRQAVRQMNLENLASVGVETQFWNAFHFGKMCFDLKEGTGQRLCLAYIPHPYKVASQISEAIARAEV